MKYIHIITIIWALALLACGDTAPTVPGDFEVNAKSSSKISLTWTLSYNQGGIDTYEVWRGGQRYDSTITTGYMDTGLMNSTTHCYAVRAVEGSEDLSDFTDTLCAKTFPYDDTGPPTTPDGFKAEALSDTEIKLTWNASTDDLKVEGYNIFRDNALVNSISSTKWTDTGLVNSTRYCYYVKAYDQLNQKSTASTTDCARTQDP